MAMILFLPLLVLLALVMLLLGQFFSAFILVVIVAIPIVYQPWRQAYITKPLMKAFRQALPTMSSTEREALESGSVWWDGDLFSGKPDWQRLLDSARYQLTPEEQYAWLG